MRGSFTTIYLAFGLSALVVACGDDAPPLPPVDSGRDTATMDGGDSAVDGGDDSATLDSSADSAIPDGGDTGVDTGVMDTGPVCIPTDRCPCTLVGTCGGGCAAGTVCVPDGCGGMACLRPGGACNDDRDCPATSTCTMTDLGRACVKNDAGAACTDSRECTPGFACEGGACVDRRVPCINNVDCPWGYVCKVGPEGEGSFCEYVARECVTNGACFMLGRCADFDGDGTMECGGEGACPATACGGGDACGTSPVFTTASCGDYGPCQATCNSGFTCVDAWGDGQAECVPTGGTCTDNTDCPSPQVCAPPSAGGAPACQAGNSGG